MAEDGIIYTVVVKQGHSSPAGPRVSPIFTSNAVCSRSSVLTPSPVSSQTTASRSQHVKAGTEEKLVLHLLHSLSMGDSSFISIFLSTYRSFTSTQRVLDILIDRYSVCKVIKSLSFRDNSYIFIYLSVCLSVCHTYIYTNVYDSYIFAIILNYY